MNEVHNLLQLWASKPEGPVAHLVFRVDSGGIEFIEDDWVYIWWVNLVKGQRFRLGWFGLGMFGD